MLSLLRDVDRLIRGDATRPTHLVDGQIDFSIGTSAVIILLSGLIAGACIGSYSVANTGLEGLPQLVATTVKIPLLYVLTIFVCFPSLFVFSALFGSRLPATSVLRLVWSNVAVISVVLASFAPIIAFFGLSGPSYPFMVLLTFVTAATAGFLGLSFMLQTLDRVIQAHRQHEALEDAGSAARPHAVAHGALSPVPTAATETDAALTTTEPADDRLGPLAEHEPVHDGTRRVFRVWAAVFGLVGAQASWVLRPIIGNPDQPFTIFREKGGSFIVGVLDAVSRLF